MYTVLSRPFYDNWHGHSVDSLRRVVEGIAAHRASAGLAPAARIFLAGDSTLDNKYWVSDVRPFPAATNGYEHVLDPPTSIPDVAFHLNTLLDAADAAGTEAVASQGKNSLGGHPFVAVNASVEATTLGMRERGTTLLPQDKFLRDSVGPNDVVVVCIGGNDIALQPTAKTMLAMGWLSRCSTAKNVAAGTAWGLGHFRKLMHDDLTAYLEALTAKQKPALLVPAMLYYPDENAKAESWAGSVLRAIGYNKSAAHLQRIIDRVFIDAVSKIRLTGVAVAPVALSTALNGKDTLDYVARVEPSVQGGQKLARLLIDHIALHYPTPTGAGAVPT